MCELDLDLNVTPDYNSQIQAACESNMYTLHVAKMMPDINLITCHWMMPLNDDLNSIYYTQRYL